MNPLRIKATNYRTFAELDVEIPEGCVAVIGENGAGKSSIVNVIDLALFGPETRSLADYLTDDAASTEMEIELTFEHVGETYRVRRHFSARGKGQTKLDLERLAPDAEIYTDGDGLERVRVSGSSWMPLTAESQKATQAVIEQLLGLSRETFRASAFLAQGDGAAFTEAKPADRKRILADVLGLDRWEELLKVARRDKSAAERQVAELAGKITTLEQTVGDPDTIRGELTTARAIAESAKVERDTAEKALEAAAQTVQELETAATAWTTRSSALAAAQARLDGQTRIREEAEQARTDAATVAAALAALMTASTLVELETRERELVTGIDQHRSAVAVREEAIRSRALVERQVAAIAADAERRRTKIGEVEERIAHLTDTGPGDDRCDVCRQILGAEALEATLSNFRAQIVTLADEARALEEQASSTPLPEIPEVPEPPTIDGVPAELHLTQIRARIQEARQHVGERARLEERLNACQAKIDAAERPEYVETVGRLQDELEQARKALDDVEEPEPGALDAAKAAALTARARMEEERIQYDSAAAMIARLEERLAHADKIAAELGTSRTQRAEIQADLDELLDLEKAYGRDGIPALIVETAAIPSIETEANRILAELGTSYRVELRTEAALKSGDGLKDTLDVVVIADGGERPYETFSGGERTRINLALRLALAELLATRRGAESRLLAIDEPEFLDEAGTMRLADVLRGLNESGKFDRVMLISHVPTLRDALDVSIEVVKDGNRSRIAA
jgi:exonuclease SbcC